MTPEKAPESTESDATVEMAPVSDPDAQDAREARYAEAIWGKGSRSRLRARAVAAVADAELAPLVARVAEVEAEVKRLRRWKAEATEVALGLQDLGEALNLPLGFRITGADAAEAARRLVSDRDASRQAHGRAIVQMSEWITRAERAEAALARVEALAEEARSKGYYVVQINVADLRAALAAAGPAVSDDPTPTLRQVAPSLGVGPDGEAATSEADLSDLIVEMRRAGALGEHYARRLEAVVVGRPPRIGLDVDTLREAAGIVSTVRPVVDTPELRSADEHLKKAVQRLRDRADRIEETR